MNQEYASQTITEVSPTLIAQCLYLYNLNVCYFCLLAISVQMLVFHFIHIRQSLSHCSIKKLLLIFLLWGQSLDFLISSWANLHNFIGTSLVYILVIVPLFHHPPSVVLWYNCVNIQYNLRTTAKMFTNWRHYDSSLYN